MSASEQQQLDWLRLIRSEGIGPATFKRLMEFYGDAGRALKALPDMAKRGGRKKPITAYAEKDAADEIKALKKMGGEILLQCDPRYPKHLTSCDDAPPVLSVLGDISLLSKQGLGIVGARNASIAGKKIAARFADDIGAEGYPIISGLARGIDTAAHKASLPHGTVAVVAGGIDVVYPEENKDLYDEIIKYGAIVAESPLGTPPDRRHFPKRNRIIAGLSHGVMVVEAAKKSGSLITANMALDYGRDVYAVPGSPLDPRAAGTNSLIKQQAAQLVTSPQDILQDLSRLSPLMETDDDQGLKGTPLAMADAAAHYQDKHDACRADIMDSLSPTPVHVDELIRETGHPPALILAILLELELGEQITRHPGNKVSLNL